MGAKQHSHVLCRIFFLRLLGKKKALSGIAPKNSGQLFSANCARFEQSWREKILHRSATLKYGSAFCPNIGKSFCVDCDVNFPSIGLVFIWDVLGFIGFRGGGGVGLYGVNTASASPECCPILTLESRLELGYLPPWLSRFGLCI